MEIENISTVDSSLPTERPVDVGTVPPASPAAETVTPAPLPADQGQNIDLFA